MARHRNRKSLGLRITELLLGGEPLEDATTYNYQRRLGPLVHSAAILPAVFWIVFVYLAAQANLAAGVATAFAVIYYKLHMLAASASDAVFDSVWERTNLQSQYFDVRLDFIETKLGAIAGKDWPVSSRVAHDNYTANLEDAYHDYPERNWRKRKQEKLDSEVDEDV